MPVIFKPKKTYIKKFATNNRLVYPKRIKFSKSALDFKMPKSNVKKTQSVSKATLKRNNREFRTKRHGSKSISIKTISKFALCVLSVLVLAIGFVAIAKIGINFIESTNLKSTQKNIEKELVEAYLPEDYIYPAPTKEIRESADVYREQNKTGEYTHSLGEVPGIYTSDYVKTCYLTFDDGPSPVTQSVLDVLDKYNIKATFFVVGNNVKAYPDLLVRMFEGGHSIGNHSYSHDYSSVYRGDLDFNDEVITTRNEINYALSGIYENYIFRFPGGSYEDYKQSYKSNLAEMGYEYIDWNALTGDGETIEPDVKTLMADLISHTDDGTKEDIVVLMHDAGAKQATADVLPQAIEYLIKRGYQFKPIWNSNYNNQ